MKVLREAVQPPSLRIPLQDILELGCGTGDMTRKIADAWPTVQIRALEVDRVQLQRNQVRNRHTNIHYEAGPAQAIPCEPESCDAVLMFKSLHHVPLDLLDEALKEVHRVLRPGGIAWFAEPVFAGKLNEIIRLFHEYAREIWKLQSRPSSTTFRPFSTILKRWCRTKADSWLVRR